MSTQNSGGDPLDFMRNMWGNMGFSLPGMTAPVLDIEELDKRVADLKTVEGWLRMNLSMLQMTIQSLEMQHATLTAVRAMSQVAAGKGGEAGAAGGPGDAADALSQAAMWPWQLMQQMHSQIKDASAAAAQQATQQAAARKAKPAAAKRPKKPE